MRLSEPEQRLSLLLTELSSSTHLGVLSANLSRILEANDTFLEMVSCTREELRAGKVDWIAMTPREHIARDARALDELRSDGTCIPFEKDLILRDGRRLPILIGGVRTCSHPLEWTCWVLALRTEKEASAAA